MAEMTNREYWVENKKLKMKVRDLETTLGVRKAASWKWRIKAALAAFWRELRV